MLQDRSQQIDQATAEWITVEMIDPNTGLLYWKQVKSVVRSMDWGPDNDPRAAARASFLSEADTAQQLAA